MLFVKWLAQVAHDPVVQGAIPVYIIGERGHENCRNRAARVDEASIELEPRHDRHVDVGDQTGRFGEARGREKFGGRRKHLDRIAQRSHEPTQGLTKRLIIFNDRNQYLFHRAACRRISRAGSQLSDYSGAPQRIVIRENATSAPPVPRKLWLISTMIAN